MKKLIRGVGIVLLVCAVVLFFAAGALKDESQGTHVSIMIDGTNKEISNGYMGYNQKGVDTAEMMQGLAVVAGLFGAGAIVASMCMKDEETPQY